MEKEAVNPEPDKSINAPKRPFLTRAEIATLAGMILCVASPFLTWKRIPIDTAELRSMPRALVTANMPHDYPVSGFEFLLHWPLTFCAVFCGVSLLILPKPQNRTRWAYLQTLSAAVCLIIPLIRFALQPGIMIALLGSICMLFGALERFGMEDTHSKRAEV